MVSCRQKVMLERAGCAGFDRYIERVCQRPIRLFLGEKAKQSDTTVSDRPCSTLKPGWAGFLFLPGFVSWGQEGWLGRSRSRQSAGLQTCIQENEKWTFYKKPDR